MIGRPPVQRRGGIVDEEGGAERLLPQGELAPRIGSCATPSPSFPARLRRGINNLTRLSLSRSRHALRDSKIYHHGLYGAMGYLTFV